MSRLPAAMLVSVLCACTSGDAITGTWRSERFPAAELIVGTDNEGTLIVGEQFSEVRAESIGGYRYELERCSMAPEGVPPICSTMLCEFEDDDLLEDDDIEDGPDLSVVSCDLGTGWRYLYAE